MLRTLALSLLLIATTVPVTAGYKEGFAAYKRGAYTTALREFKEDAEKGNASAQYFLGILYGKGRGVPRNYILAYKWYSLAAARGNKRAAKSLDFYEKRMTPAQISSAQALAAKWQPKKTVVKTKSKAKATPAPQKKKVVVASASALKSVVAGARFYFNRTIEIDDSFLVDFTAKGRMTGARQYTRGSQRHPIQVHESDRGTWSANGNKLCWKWGRWDDGKKTCYVIKGSGKKYVASGANGILTGHFMIAR